MQETTPSNKKEKNKFKGAFKGFVIRISIISASLFILLFFVLGIHIYHDNNMAPWMRDGDLIFTLKPASNFADRVVSYKSPDGIRFGRVVGIEGDKVFINSEKYTLNDSIPVEKVYYDTRSETEIDVTVPEGCVYILNDNREDMSDSREYGCVNKKDIEGVVVFSMSRRGF